VVAGLSSVPKFLVDHNGGLEVLCGSRRAEADQPDQVGVVRMGIAPVHDVGIGNAVRSERGQQRQPGTRQIGLGQISQRPFEPVST
jgi:hypothetical protein